MYDNNLIFKLIAEHRHSEGKNRGKVDRAAVCSKYKEMTGKLLYQSKLDRAIKAFNSENQPMTFNERLDDAIDNPQGLLTERDLLIARGLDPLEFELGKSNTMNAWWSDIPAETLKRIRNGQIKLTFQKRIPRITVEDIKYAIDSLDIKSIYIEQKTSNPKGLCEVFLTDMHFPFMTYEDYKPHQEEIYRYINSQEWIETLFVIGSDLFHVDNTHGTTTNGTQVGFEVNMNEMYEQAYKFYKPLIDVALEKSQKVTIKWLSGNHDKNSSFGFVYCLSKEYPQIQCDLEEKTRKAHVFNDVLLLFAHGDLPKNFKQAYKVLFEEFKYLIAHAKIVELHSGDKHHQWSQEDIGIVMRGLGTAKETDRWHYDNGFIGSRRVFQLFVYSSDNLKAQIYVDGC